MSKKYDREEKALDRLEKENRELKAIVRSLQKQVKKATKGFRRSYKEEPPIPEEKEPVKPICKKCEQGILIEVNILNRTWIQCENCQYRSKTLKKE